MMLHAMELWWTFVPILGIFGSIAGIFGASAQKRAASEALRILNEAKEAGIKESKALSAMFDPFVASGGERLGTSFDIMKRLTQTAEASATAPGLSEAEKISFEDAQRLINENLVSTGNLRSGAAGFAGAELGRRTLADAASRRFNYLQLAMNAGSQLGGIAQATGQLGLGGKQLSANLLQSVMGLAAPMASAAMAKGAAEAAGIQAWGGIGDSLLGAGVAGFGGVPGLSSGFGSAGLGLMSGGSGLLNYSLLSSLGAGGGGRYAPYGQADVERISSDPRYSSGFGGLSGP